MAKPSDGGGVATMLPYTLGLLVIWMVLLTIFLVFPIPVGPGAPLFLK